MEAQIPRQVEVHYPPDYSTSLADTLFNYRQANDDLLKQAIVLKQQNRRLGIKVDQYKSSLPLFLINWWNSNQGVQKIGIFLSSLGQSLQAEIDSMNHELCRCRGQFQMAQGDYSQQMQEAERLKQQITELKRNLQELRSRNQSNRQIEMLDEMRPSQIMKRLFQQKQLRSFEVTRHKNLQKKIQAAFTGRQNRDIQKEYYKEKEMLIKHLIKRKEQLQAKLNRLTHQLTTVNQQISVFESQKNAELMMKQSIIRKHKRLQQLKRELTDAKTRKEEVLKRKKDLQENMCEQQMEKAVQGLDGLTQQYKRLALRTLQLLKRSLDTTNIGQIEQMLVQK